MTEAIRQDFNPDPVSNFGASYIVRFRRIGGKVVASADFVRFEPIWLDRALGAKTLHLEKRDIVSIRSDKAHFGNEILVLETRNATYKFLVRKSVRAQALTERGNTRAI